MAILIDRLPAGHWSRPRANGNSDDCVDVDEAWHITVGKQCDSVETHLDAAERSLAAFPSQRVWSHYSGEELVSFFIVNETPLILIQVPNLDGVGVHHALIRGLTIADVRADQASVSGYVSQRPTPSADRSRARVTMTAEIEIDVWFDTDPDHEDEYWQNLAERAGAAAVTIQGDDGQPVEYRWLALHAERP